MSKITGYILLILQISIVTVTSYAPVVLAMQLQFDHKISGWTIINNSARTINYQILLPATLKNKLSAKHPLTITTIFDNGDRVDSCEISKFTKNAYVIAELEPRKQARIVINQAYTKNFVGNVLKSEISSDSSRNSEASSNNSNHEDSEEDKEKDAVEDEAQNDDQDPAALELEQQLNFAEQDELPRYKKRLFVGEGDFSYTAAFLEKHQVQHPKLIKDVVATEYQSDASLAKKYPETFTKNIARCQAIANAIGEQCNIEFNVDATKLHEDRRFCRKRFQRIHFNFPMVNGERDRSYQTNKELLKNFFLSASQVQKIGDRIHITLPWDTDHWREYRHYAIYIASAHAGYQQIKRHRFRNRSYFNRKKDRDQLNYELARYPLYQHQQDIDVKGFSEDTKLAIRNAREHVFIKINEDNDPSKIFRKTPPGKGGAKEDLTVLTDLVSTDDDSSDYYEETNELEQERRIKELSLNMAESSGTIGPRSLPGWQLEDTKDDGNCFFSAVALQLQQINHPEIANTPVGTTLRDRLRLYAGPRNFQDHRWVEYHQIIALAKKFQIIIAIVDTRTQNHNFVYHYINDRGQGTFTADLASISNPNIRTLPIIRLAYTGNHYLSVKHYKLPWFSYLPQLNKHRNLYYLIASFL